MNRLKQLLLSAMLVAVMNPATAWSSSEDEAIRLCKDKIRDVYDVRKLRDVWAERLGNHKFKVHGKVKRHDHLYPFRCKVKRGYVQSYHYDGPHGRHSDDDDSDVGTAIAVGAGLAIIAALASQSGGDDAGDDGQLRASKTVLEDECHDAIESRIRYDRDGSARVNFTQTSMEHRDLTGKGTVTYYDDSPNRMRFTCYFDKQGRVLDTSYSLH